MNLSELRALKPRIMAIAERYGVSNIRVFGSVARGDADENSDVDLLVEMKKGGLFALIGFKHDVEDLLHCKVDVGQIEGVRNPIRHARLLKEQVPL